MATPTTLNGVINAISRLSDNVEELKKTTGSAATTSSAGLMSAADKRKLDGLGGVASTSAAGLMSIDDKSHLNTLWNERGSNNLTQADRNTLNTLNGANLSVVDGCISMTYDAPDEEIA